MDNCTNISLRRRAIWQAGLAVFLISACDRKPMRVHLDISLFSYLNRPIYEVSMNGTHFGGAMRNSFYGSNAVMLMQPIVLGPQLVSWRLDGPEGMPRNGELVMAKIHHCLPTCPAMQRGWLSTFILMKQWRSSSALALRVSSKLNGGKVS